MQKYTVFIKPLTMLTDTDRETLRSNIQEAMRHSSPVQVGANEFEIQVSDEEGPRVGEWNRLKKATDGLAYLVWYRHENEGVTCSSFPEGAADELGAILQSHPHDRLQAIRGWIQSIV